MADYISREAFIADCEGRYCAPCKEQGKDANGVRCRACWVDDMLSEVLDAPAADVEPVRHGRWLGQSGLFQGECSVCGYRTYDKTADWARKYWPHCPICGSKMDLEDETDDD